MLHSSGLLQCLGVIKSFEQPLKLQFFQLLMIFSSWWSSDLLMKTTFGDVTSDEVLPMNLLLMMMSSLQEHLSSESLFFRCFKLPSCWFHCSHLFFQNLWLKETLNFLFIVLYTWTNISISNWQFLIPCYHQNSKGNVKHILFQQICHLLCPFVNSSSQISIHKATAEFWYWNKWN